MQELPVGDVLFQARLLVLTRLQSMINIASMMYGGENG
jgi:hypothetical protein